jgi:hypothetical protein
MRHGIRSLVCVVVVGALGVASVACTMQRTNTLPGDNLTEEPAKQPAKPDNTGAPAETPPVDAGSDTAAPVVKPTVDAAPAAPTGPGVVSFTLINCDTDLPIANYDPIPEGTTLTLAALPTQNLNIRANTVTPNAEVIGSVAFDLDGVTNFHIEGAAPYALGSDNAGDYTPLTPPLAAGAHSLSAKTYSEAAAAGTAGNAKSLNFTVQ